MSEPQASPPKPSLWQMIRIGWRPYRRLYGYVKPYRWRFILGIACGAGLVAPVLVATVKPRTLLRSALATKTRLLALS